MIDGELLQVTSTDGKRTVGFGWFAAGTGRGSFTSFADGRDSSNLLFIISVDILLTSLPLDASTHFSNVLKPYLRALINRHGGRGVGAEREDEDALSRATFTSEGKLPDKHSWLLDLVEKWRSASASSTAAWRPDGIEAISTTAAGDFIHTKVLMLGSGMVAGPAFEEISKRADDEPVVGQ